jgi:hypothetical protein
MPIRRLKIASDAGWGGASESLKSLFYGFQYTGQIPVVEKTPYIIVDNRKLLPINRLQPSQPASNNGPERKETPFGVIDRVTISAEAREKSRRYQARRATAPIAEQAPSNQVAPAPSALLPDASLKRNPDDPSQ